MPKSSRPRRQPAPEESTIQQTKTVSAISLPPNSLSKIVDHLASLSTLIASLFVLGAAVYDALRGPDISSDLNGDRSRPFAIPFIVKNNSSWFPMQDTKIYCQIEKIVMTNNRSLERFPVMEISHAAIGSAEIINFRCAVAGAQGRNLFVANPVDILDANNILDANISIVVEYTMLGVSRTSPRAEFTWYAGGTPPHWIKGKIAD
jgi:hypothetical protein